MSASQHNITGPYAIIPQQYVETLLVLQGKLKEVIAQWAIGGDLGEALRAVSVNPDVVEILTSKAGVEQIFKSVEEFQPVEPSTQIRQLPRKAVIGGKEYPVYNKSCYLEFCISGIKIEVYGNLQFKINDWDWGDPLEFTPEYTFVVGKKINVVPLAIKYELHTLLGWTDRAEKIAQVLARPKPGIRG